MSSPMTPAQIAERMDGTLREVETGRSEALLPSPCVQNHAAFLHAANGSLSCCWFAGSLEGKADISIYRSTLAAQSSGWSPPEKLSDDTERSEQNPVLFTASDGRTLLFHTAQPGGNQDECSVRMREAGSSPVSLSLPGGTFIRSPLFVRSDDAWLLPLFRCIPKPGYRWNGSHDTAAIALSTDAGRHWREIDIPQSEGCVHTTLIAVDTNTIAAFFRRRQADFIFRCESRDGGDTWSTPVATDIPNNNSSIAAITLQDGRVAIACNPVNRDSSELRRKSLYDEVDEDDERVSATGAVIRCGEYLVHH